VQVLEDGLASGDASAPSDDHAVAIDPMLIDRIEILRGPATLLYGSAATGGVVNLIDNRIPTSVPERAVVGLYEARADTAADERSGVLRLDGGGGSFAWHFDGSYRDAGDYDIPGAARRELAEERHHDHDEEHEHDEHHHDEYAEGTLENSFVESQSGTVGANWIANRGFIGASVRLFETEYGIPAPHSHAGHDHDDDHSEEEDSFAFIDMEQKSWSLKAGLEDPAPGFTRATLRLGYRDYQHLEIEMEGDEHGHEHEEDHEHDHSDHDDDHGHDHAHEPTLFDVETFLSRLELRTVPVAGWTGAIGLQIDSQDFKTVGEEIFIAPNQTDTMAVFALQERRVGDFILSFGARLENTDVSVDPGDHSHEHHEGDHHDDHHDDHHHDGHSDVDERSFTTWSASFGTVWEINDLWRTSLNISRAQRAPSATELFADGPHLATFSFEKGTPGLIKETTTAWDLGLRRHSDNLDLELNLFHKDVNNLVYLEDTGEMRDGLTLREFKQDNGQFYGLEALAQWKLHGTGLGDFDLRTGYDLVHGELADGSNLPRISPERLTVGVDWGTGPWRAGVEWQRVFRQDRPAEFEGETPGYNLTHATVAYQFMLGQNWAEIFFQGRNLGDNRARVHTSALREYAPLPGRTFRLGLRGSF
jgi:iron complex outermembrane receptor protein